MSTEIKAAVSEILEYAGVTMRAHLVGEKKNAFGGKIPMDQWRIEFVSKARDNTENFDYFTGIGNREKPKWGRLSMPGLSIFDNGPEPRRGTLLYAEWEKLAKPVAPDAACVLYSLIRDSDAVGMSFESWCEELGYDSDSRKAEQTYRECQANADKLRRVFSAADILALENALQDY
jgi:hypothetical protein